MQQEILKQKIEGTQRKYHNTYYEAFDAESNQPSFSTLFDEIKDGKHKFRLCTLDIICYCFMKEELQFLESNKQIE